MPRPVKNTSMLKNAPYEGRDLETLSILSNYRDWIITPFRPYLHGATTEIGAGLGTFSQAIIDEVETLELVEPSPELVPQLTEKFSKTPGVTVIGKTLEDHLADMAVESRDCIIMVNVLEHIMDDTQVLKDQFRMLKPGGRLLIFVPALPWLFSKMDAEHGHYRRYYKSGLVDLVRMANFKIISARYFDILGIIPWWLICKVGRRTTFSPFLSGVYDKLFVPVGRVLESVLAPPLGKNILLIAEKAEDSDSSARCPS
ncbi:MAG: class I SAM-dependent methyltransferase [Proteobacteria bacterium]|nr:class I SAM-dependent methyltransferase [Pseudomonadota bacterium]